VFATILFYLFGAVLIASALGVVLAKNPVHSALLLVLCFFNSAVIWMLLQAEFLAITLVLVYVGAVMVLFLFVVMMLDVNVEEFRKGLASYWPLAATVAGFVVFAMVNVIVIKHLGGVALTAAPDLPAAPYSNTRSLGTVLFTKYAYPAQLAALILLVASVAAIVLTLRRRPGGKPQDIAAQVAVRARDRVRLVKMPSEKRS
jgi:NADH-quinone oxidoreductase subunit J